MNAKKAEIEEATEDAKRFGERPPDSELMSRKAEFDAEQKSFDEREKGEVFTQNYKFCCFNFFL